MSVIIRLQNLPWSANSLDIRHYFRGLSIPEGGVHIVGGEMGDAFIAFSTDEDARQAMMMTGGKIKEVQISLMLSSRNEMQKVIEAARQASMTNSLAQLLGAQNVPPLQLGQQQVTGQGTIPGMQIQHHLLGKDRKDSRSDKKDSSDVSTSSYDTVRRDKKEKSRSRSRDRMRKDRRDRDRDRRRRSRSRSRSRERRRRRSHSRSRGRDTHGRDGMDRKDDMKKDKDLVTGNNNSLQDATNLPNLDILNPNQWRMMNPGGLPQNAPVLNSLTNLDILRNIAVGKPLLANPIAGAAPVPLLGNDVNPGERYQSMSVKEDIGFGGRGRGGDFPNRRDRDGFGRDMDMNGGGNSRDGGMGPDNPGRGNFRNFDDGNGPSYPGNFPYNDGNHFGMGNSYGGGGGGGYQQRNGNNPNRFGNFNAGDNFGQLNNREQRGLMDYPMSMPNEGFSSRSDRFEPNRDDRVDEFGRSIQLRNRQKNSDNSSDDFPRNQGGNFPGFQSRFSNVHQGSGPQPLLRGRDSWPPTRQGDGFPDRRNFRGGGGGYDDVRGGSFRGNDFPDRSQGRSRRDDFHGRGDRGSRFGEKNGRDDGKFEKDCCVEIRGLAPSIAYGDVRRPFNNLKVIIRDIKFFDYTSTDKKCRLRFWNFENKKKALQNPKRIVVDGKQVQLLHINDSEFEECVDEGVRRPTEARFSDDEEDLPSETYLQVRDMLTDHVEADVVRLFAPAVIDKIVFEPTPDGKLKTGLVKFAKAIDAKVSIGTPCRKIGDHSVMLMTLTQEDFVERARKLENGIEVETGNAESSDVILIDEDEREEVAVAAEGSGESNCVLMKNLPFEATDRDVCDFFSDIGLVPKSIHLMLDPRGQPSGEAFCEFGESDQATTACSKNGMPMGKNNLAVQKVSRSRMNDAIGGKAVVGEGGSGSDKCMVAVENIPFRAGVFDIINFFGWSYKLTEEDVIRKYNDRGQPTGDARVTFRTAEDAIKAVRFLNNRNLMGRIVRMKIL